MLIRLMDFRAQMNDNGKKRRPCLFVIDFDGKEAEVIDLEECGKQGVYYAFGAALNNGSLPRTGLPVALEKTPVAIAEYARAFRRVQDELRRGNTYLVNLTFSTPVTINLSLTEIFARSAAPYRLLFRDRFVVFSPEAFVFIRGNCISTFPMKGTIDAAVPDAARVILADEKEKAEHVTIVDLLRNDLGRVSRRVKVERFRYLGEVITHERRLLQVSSEIRGELSSDWHARLGDILGELLPAGSVTGAPKKKTVEIIREAETYERGYYTGVFGCYDGERMESAVMIRFIERLPDGSLVYKSGGGITADSVLEREYREMVDKVYVPIA